MTGGATGIGKAIAVAFAIAGARVVMLDVDREKGKEALDLMRRYSPKSEFLPTDLRNSEAVAAAAEVFRGRNGADVLVNNAATIGRIAPTHELERSECEAVIRTNLLGPFFLSQLAARGMIAARRAGTIINVLTIQAAFPVPGYSAYVASKGAMDALTLAMAVDLAPHNIRVNGIRVGSVLTENYLRVLPEKLKQQMAALSADAAFSILDQRAATLVNRMGRPADIASVALFLASKEASFLTGSVIRADGGRAISRKVEPLA